MRVASTADLADDGRAQNGKVQNLDGLENGIVSQATGVKLFEDPTPDTPPRRSSNSTVRLDEDTPWAS